MKSFLKSPGLWKITIFRSIPNGVDGNSCRISYMEEHNFCVQKQNKKEIGPFFWKQNKVKPSRTSVFIARELKIK